MLRLLLSASILVLVVASSLRADDEQKKAEPEQPPAPKFKAPMPAPVPTPTVIVPYQRTDTREVWQHYAPNRMGRMVPRVIVTPYGALYSRTLQPYPWAGNNPNAVLPIAVD
jgi:hypothetical protein